MNQPPAMLDLFLVQLVGPLCGPPGQVSEKLKSRFMSCADGDSEENARLKRENLRSVLECTDAWTITQET